MKLYRAKIPVIAREVIEVLSRDGDIEVAPGNREEAEKDLVAIMEDALRRDQDFRNHLRDHMAARNIPFDEYGKTRKALAEEAGHPSGDEIERFLTRQFLENLMISRFVDEVFGEDKAMFKKVLGVIVSHDVDEQSIRDEAMAKIKNVREGTVEYEIALQNAIREVKKRRGLLGPRGESADR